MVDLPQLQRHQSDHLFVREDRGVGVLHFSRVEAESGEPGPWSTSCSMKMFGGVIRHAGRAPSCVSVAEDLAEPARSWRFGKRVVDEHPQRRGLPARCNFKSHPIVTNNEEIWSSSCLPNLQDGRVCVVTTSSTKRGMPSTRPRRPIFEPTARAPLPRRSGVDASQLRSSGVRILLQDGIRSVLHQGLGGGRAFRDGRSFCPRSSQCCERSWLTFCRI